MIKQNKKNKKFINIVFTDTNELNKAEPATIRSVRPGYFRNYIIPMKLGEKATPNLIKELNHRKEQLARKNLQFREKCIGAKNLLENLGKFEVPLKVGEGGKIFGKVTGQHILTILKENTSIVMDINLEKGNFKLPKIKQIGEYVIEVLLTNDLTANITIEIVPK